MTSRRERYRTYLFLLACIGGLAGCNRGDDELNPVEQARRDIAAGRAKDAAFALERLVEGGAPASSVAAYIGEAKLALGDLRAAGRWLDLGEFSQDTRAHGFRMQGRLAMARGTLPQAGQAFDRALAVDADNPELWVDIGRLRYRGGEQLEAIEAGERAIALGPDNPAALQFRGLLARDAQGLAEGSKWFARALEQRPEDIELRADLAATLGDGEQAREALDALRQGETRAVSSPRGLYLQAVIAARGGRLAVARDLLQRSRLDEDGVPAALLLSGIIDLRSGNYASAAQTLDTLHRRQPDNMRVVDLLAFALSRSGGDAELIARFGAMVETGVGSNYLRTLVGRSHETLGNRAEAAAFLDRAALGDRGLSVLPARGSGGVGAARDAIRDAIRRGDGNLAASKARELVRRYPGSADVMALVGDAELSRGDRPAAARAYLQSAKVRRPWVLVPRLASSLGSKRDARRLLEDVVAAQPANGEAAAMLADAYALEGKWRQSAMLLDHAIAHGQGRVPWVLGARSMAARRLGDNDLALKFAIEAHELQPMNPGAIRALHDALPADQAEARVELALKLRSLTRR